MNSAARAVTKTLTFLHITPIPESLHWLKIIQRIKYKVLSLTYKSLKTGQPSYLRSLLLFPSHRLLSPPVIFLSPLVLNLQADLILISLCIYFVEQSPF